MAMSAMSPPSRASIGLGHTSQRQQRPTPTAGAHTPSSTARSPSAVAGRPLLSPSAAARSAIATSSGTTARGTRHQSPSYFGLVFDPASPPSNAAADSNEAANGVGLHANIHSHSNFSPPTSKVRSTAAASPRAVPLDQNPEFEAFKRQAELNKGRNISDGFFGSGGAQPFGSLSGFSVRTARASIDSSRSVPASLRQQSWKENSSSVTTDSNSAAAKTATAEQGPTATTAQTQRRSPKRVLSSTVFDVSDRPRRNSPAGFTNRDESLSSQTAEFLDRSQEDQQAMPDSPAMSIRPTISPQLSSTVIFRAETLPSRTEDGDIPPDGTPGFVTAQHIVGLLDTASEDVLLLDLRVSTQYAKATIAGALNLCIPTTLLKRPSFNVQKLAEVFKDPAQRARFERWRNCRCIVVFDQATGHMKDAATCMNTLNKFASEGWSGGSYIIRGGFQDLSAKFPSLVRSGSAMMASSSSKSKPSLSLSTADRPEVAPVVGGCPMPATKNAANPFFGNIRQNMDLIGGVGQMVVKHPSNMTEHQERHLPSWLRKAVNPQNEGKLVSDKFLAIEKREQKRMQEALSGNVTYTSPPPSSSGATQHQLQSPTQLLSSPSTPFGVTRRQHESGRGKVQIAGIEKGSKNRYNNIWPYEHSRVRLLECNEAAGDCDYVNANFVKTSWSSKRYIATQGPIPATFGDFWNVIWQQDVRVIVMLTAESEGGQLKAHNYWKSGKFDNLELTYLSEHRASLEPERIRAHYRRNSKSGGSQNAAPAAHAIQSSKTAHSNSSSKQLQRPSVGQRRATVTNSTAAATNTVGSHTNGSGVSLSAGENDHPYVIVRRFTLARADRPFERMREITQLQYSHWPDFGAPAHPTHLLGLVEQCNAVARQSQSGGEKDKGGRETTERPILVHCSAGCGRTGTFCTVDSVIDLMRRQRAHRSQRKQKENEKADGREPTPMEVDSSMPRSGTSGGGHRMSIDAADAAPSNLFASAMTMASPTSASTVTSGSSTPMAATKNPFALPESVAQSVGSKEAKGEDNWLERDDIDLVEKAVEEFRLQRLSMVQSLRQFVLCYESVLEWLVAEDEKEAEEGLDLGLGLGLGRRTKK